VKSRTETESLNFRDTAFIVIHRKMAGATGLRFTFPRHDVPSHDSPLFERMGTEEYAQLQDCRLIIDSLQQRVHDLERINLDLEFRLEDQAKQCMEVEKECVSIERSWKAKCTALEKEISNWKLQFEAQKLKGDRVREHLSRTERELYGILQRKYELIRGPGSRPTGPNASNPPAQKLSWELTGNSFMKKSDSVTTTTGPYGSVDDIMTTPQVMKSESLPLWCSTYLASIACELKKDSIP
jgi:hypothetical protein